MSARLTAARTRANTPRACTWQASAQRRMQRPAGEWARSTERRLAHAPQPRIHTRYLRCLVSVCLPFFLYRIISCPVTCECDPPAVCPRVSCDDTGMIEKKHTIKRNMGTHNGCMLLILGIPSYYIYISLNVTRRRGERHPLGRRRACQTSLLLIIILVEPGEPVRDDGERDVGDLRALSLLDARPKHPDGTPALERRPGGDS